MTIEIDRDTCTRCGLRIELDEPHVIESSGPVHVCPEACQVAHHQQEGVVDTPARMARSV